jgi:hypothetical protein
MKHFLSPFAPLVNRAAFTPFPVPKARKRS